MSTLPSSVRVGCFDYSVSVDSDRLNRDGHGGEVGMCYRHTLEIVLRDGLHVQRQREVLWHEVKHAIAELVGLATDDTVDEEQAILRVAGCELMVLRDNPALVAFLLPPWLGCAL